MPAFDVLAVPSRYESLGYVLLEAAVAGIPMVSSPVGVAADVIEAGRNGIIVPNVDDPNAWSTAINRVTEPQALEEAFNCARDRNFSFSIEKMVDEIEDVYKSAALRIQQEASS
jgi:glycosyltransferase involved in cell wall biosynthesis